MAYRHFKWEFLNYIYITVEGMYKEFFNVENINNFSAFFYD